MATDPDLGGAITPDHGRVPGYAYGASDDGLAAAEIKQHAATGGAALAPAANTKQTNGLLTPPPTAETTFPFVTGPEFLPPDAQATLTAALEIMNSWQVEAFQTDGVPVNVEADDTVTVGDTTYTFVAVLDPETPNEVLVGATPDASLQNLADAINAAPASQGIAYSVGTVANTNSSAAPVNEAAHLIVLTPVDLNVAVSVSESTGGARLVPVTNVMPDGTIVVLSWLVTTDDGATLLDPPVWYANYQQVGTTYDRTVQDEGAAEITGTPGDVLNFVGTITIPDGDVTVPVYVTTTGTGVDADSGAVETTTTVYNNQDGSVASTVSTVTATDPTTGDPGTITTTVTFDPGTAAPPTVDTTVTVDPTSTFTTDWINDHGGCVGAAGVIGLENAPEELRVVESEWHNSQGNDAVPFYSGPTYPTTAALYIGRVTLDDSGGPEGGWRVIAEYDSNQDNSMLVPRNYGDAAFVWMPQAIIYDTCYVGSISRTNPDDSTTLVFVFTETPGLGLHITAYTAEDLPATTIDGSLPPDAPPLTPSNTFPTDTATISQPIYLDPVTYTFQEGQTTLPRALRAAVIAATTAIEEDGTFLKYTGIALPYVTHDGADGEPQVYTIEDFSATDGWTADIDALHDAGYGLTTDDVSDDNSAQMAVDLGLTDADGWSYLGSVVWGEADNIIFVYTTKPGVFVQVDPTTGAISTDLGEIPSWADTGTWSYTTIGGGPTPPIYPSWGQYTYVGDDYALHAGGNSAVPPPGKFYVELAGTGIVPLGPVGTVNTMKWLANDGGDNVFVTFNRIDANGKDAITDGHLDTITPDNYTFAFHQWDTHHGTDGWESDYLTNVDGSDSWNPTPSVSDGSGFLTASDFADCTCISQEFGVGSVDSNDPGNPTGDDAWVTTAKAILLRYSGVG